MNPVKSLASDFGFSVGEAAWSIRDVPNGIFGKGFLSSYLPFISGLIGGG